MLSFSRLTSILLFVLSLSLLACALPTTSSQTNALATRGVDEELLAICDKLVVDVKAKIAIILAIEFKVLADILVHCEALIALITVAAKAIIALGAKLDIHADIKAKIAAHIVVVIKLCVDLCVKLVAKLGITPCLGLLVKMDACLHLLLHNLSLVVNGIIALIVKLLIGIDITVLLKLKLNLCLSILGL